MKPFWGWALVALSAIALIPDAARADTVLPNTTWGSIPGENSSGASAQITGTAPRSGNGAVELIGDRTRFTNGNYFSTSGGCISSPPCRAMSTTGASPQIVQILTTLIIRRRLGCTFTTQLRASAANSSGRGRTITFMEMRQRTPGIQPRHPIFFIRIPRGLA